MSAAPMLTTTAHVALKEPELMLRKLISVFAEYSTVVGSAPSCRLETRAGSVALTAGADALAIRIDASSQHALFALRAALAERLLSLSQDDRPSLLWAGAGAAEREIPSFKAVSVARARNITPSMRRITLACDDISHFERDGMHVSVLIPPSGRMPVWPRVGEDGRVIWPVGGDELARRTYSIRRIDREASELDIDVVLHGDSPGATWARTARAGDPIGLIGPSGGELPAADWYLLAGDETALPAIARIAEELPAKARATILLEVPNLEECQMISTRAHLDVHWLPRNGAPAGTTSLLETAIRSLAWPKCGAPYVLVGCEKRSAREIRAFLRRDRGMVKDRHLVVGYWQRF
ncbi:siderophore-interacting protein [Bosea rubneri]|uniref:Siderophore-interacting protein n=1 Tax=Bosea rubneri TaxID=3075434 RepID=A0ABU3S6T9_9HYPH|nr:siderophore-interacting protein [Bosea sp. ZW T0_25]MDU0340484.1 siderophore-interacting protein [Bosea sp. ZW T0_25]